MFASHPSPAPAAQHGHAEQRKLGLNNRLSSVEKRRRFDALSSERLSTNRMETIARQAAQSYLGKREAMVPILHGQFGVFTGLDMPTRSRRH
jgi:hypothetical protein